MQCRLEIDLRFHLLIYRLNKKTYYKGEGENYED